MQTMLREPQILSRVSASDSIGDFQMFSWRKFVALLNLERETGIEPATNGLGSRYSTIELLPPAATRLF